MREVWTSEICLYLITLFLGCNTQVTQTVDSTNNDTPSSWMERDIFGFRLWMILLFIMAGVLIIVIVLCCIYDYRIPRTKQEIEADYERHLLAQQFIHQMKQIPTDRTLKVIKSVPPNAVRVNDASQSAKVTSQTTIDDSSETQRY